MPIFYLKWWDKQDTRITFYQIMFENKYEIVRIYDSIIRIILQIVEKKTRKYILIFLFKRIFYNKFIFSIIWNNFCLASTWINYVFIIHVIDLMIFIICF